MENDDEFRLKLSSALADKEEKSSHLINDVGSVKINEATQSKESSG